jgi:hypothetical protein
LTPGRVLLVAPGSREWDLASYLRDVFTTLGWTASLFDYSRARGEEPASETLLRVARAEAPDLVLGLKLEAIEPGALAELRRRGARVVLWYVDCFTPDVPDWIVSRIANVDLFATTAKGMVDRYRALGSTPVEWIVEGVHLPAFPDLDVAPEQRRLYASTVAFVGNVFQPPVADAAIASRRLRLLSKVGERFGLKIWGPQAPEIDRLPRPLPFRVMRWPAYNEECVKVCRSSDVVLGMNTVDSVELYFSNRTFLTLASGGFHVTSWVPGLDSMFENHRHLVWYRSDEECLETIAHYLDRPEDRARIAAEGARHVRSEHAMTRQVEKLIDAVAALPPGRR